MAESEESHNKSPGVSSKFRPMYKAASPSSLPWKEAYRKVFICRCITV